MRASKTAVTFRLRPGKRGVELRLYDLEAAIMDLVWSRSLEAFSVTDVLELMERKRTIAYTTVMTTVSRLFDKKLLTRVREGKRYLYSPRISRQEFLEATAREVLDGVVDEPTALALLVEKVSDASATELDELERRIQQRRKALRK
jgi:predicted transcriptional regulator